MKNKAKTDDAIEYAKRLIRKKDYEAARQVLNKLRTLEANELLAKLNSISPKRRSSTSKYLLASVVIIFVVVSVIGSFGRQNGMVAPETIIAEQDETRSPLSVTSTLNSALTTSDETLFTDEQVNFRFTGTRYYYTAGAYQPEKAVFLVILAEIQNNTTQTQCVRARSLRLLLDDVEYIPPNHIMDALSEVVERSFTGAVTGHCIEGGSTEETFTAFDIPARWEKSELRYREIQRPIIFEFPDVPTNVATSDVPSTELPSVPLVASNTPILTPANDINPNVIVIVATIYYAVTDANMRSCPNTDCERMGTLASGESITIDGLVVGSVVNGNNQWLRGMFNGRVVYIHSTLISTRQPAQAITGGSGGALPEESDFSTAVPSPFGRVTCPGNCQTAQASGISAEDSAMCGLDRDDDGFACYGD